MVKSSDSVAHLAAFLTVLIWGTTFVSTKILLLGFDPIEILLLRFILGFIILSLLTRQKRQKNKKTEFLYVFAGLTGVTLYFLLENIALTFSLASIVGVAVCIAPFFTGILAHFFLEGEKLRLQFLIGFVIAIGGIALISFDGSHLVAGDILAVLLSLAAAFMWGIYSILLRKIGSDGYSAITVTRSIFFYGIVFMLPALFFFGVQTDLQENIRRFSNPLYFANLLYLGIFASSVCFATWSFSVKKIGAMKTSVYIYLSPVITVLFSVIILSEPLTPRLFFGMLLTLCGLILSELKWAFFRKKKTFRI